MPEIKPYRWVCIAQIFTSDGRLTSRMVVTEEEFYINAIQLAVSLLMKDFPLGSKRPTNQVQFAGIIQSSDGETIAKSHSEMIRYLANAINVKEY
ncbi:hypothetical protein [Chroococcidiopsis sp.]|uniref:hypothetical protein n=1 Tax=Chroococcidiopsis sp. TaxID=3088168 RepID=UPI003F30F226